jgi:hypothetical protein
MFHLKNVRLALPTLVVASACLGACTSAAPLSVTTWGEEFIEQGLPAEEFEDGWAVTFSKFLVVYTAVQVKDAAGTEVSTFSAPAVFDLVQPGPVTVIDLGEVTAQRFDDVGAVVAPAAGAVAGSAAAADVALMNDGGLSVHVVGSATKGADTATFSWSFDTATRYANCETEGEGEGIVVRAGEDNAMQLTVHGDHLFYDDLAADDAVLRFDAIFAADGQDGTAADNDISQAELDAVDLTTLPNDQYGNAGAAETLGDFVASLSRTLIHLNGEGECSIAAP